jgi:hypothetical protein
VRFVGEVQPAGGQAPVTSEVTGRRFTLASPLTATVLGALVLALAVTGVALSFLARNSAVSDGGAGLAAVLVYAAVGVVVARHQPRNPIGWIMAAGALAATVSQDVKLYLVLDYRLHHGSLPFGPVAIVQSRSGIIVELLFPLVILLFPDGRLPSPRWRWTLWVYLAAGALAVAAQLAGQAIAVSGQHVSVTVGGQLVNGSAGVPAVLGIAFFPCLLVCAVICLSWVVRQLVSYRRSAGERRQQLKWLVSGAAVLVLSLVALDLVSDQAGRAVAFVGLAALPVSIGVGILKYRLYEIDRIISRTLAYAIVTGLLVGVYAGLVLLATRVLPISSPIAVAGATLAVAALFTPLRRRVQRVVDRRFNRARYDADQTVAAFAARLQDAVDLDAVRDDLAGVVQKALEPAHVSVWMSERG